MPKVIDLTQFKRIGKQAEEQDWEDNDSQALIEEHADFLVQMESMGFSRNSTM